MRLRLPLFCALVPLLLAAAFGCSTNNPSVGSSCCDRNVLLNDPALLSYYTLAVVYTTNPTDPHSFGFDSQVYPPCTIASFRCGRNSTHCSCPVGEHTIPDDDFLSYRLIVDDEPFEPPLIDPIIDVEIAYQELTDEEILIDSGNDVEGAVVRSSTRSNRRNSRKSRCDRDFSSKICSHHHHHNRSAMVTLPTTCPSAPLTTGVMVSYFQIPVGSSIADIKVIIRSAFFGMHGGALDTYLLSLCPFDAFLPDCVVPPAGENGGSHLRDQFDICRSCCSTVSPSLLTSHYDSVIYLRFAVNSTDLFNEAVNTFDVRAVKAVTNVERELCQLKQLEDELKRFEDKISAQIKHLRADSNNWFHQAELTALKYLQHILQLLIQAIQRSIIAAEDLLMKIMMQIEEIACIAKDRATPADAERLAILARLLENDIAIRCEQATLMEAIEGIRSGSKAVKIVYAELQAQIRNENEIDTSDFTCSCNFSSICLGLIDPLFPAPFGCMGGDMCTDVTTMTRIFSNDVFLGMSCTTGLASQHSILHFLRDHFGSNAAIVTVISDAVGSLIGNCANANCHDLLRQIRLAFASVSAIDFLRVIHDRRAIAKLDDADRVFWNQQWIAAGQRWGISDAQFHRYFSQFLLTPGQHN